MGLVLLAACTKGTPKAESPGATLGTAAPTTTTTNPYAVPPVIDAAYVNRVLAGLDAVFGDAVRLVVAAKSIPSDALERLKSLYGSGKSLQLAIDLLQEDMRRGFDSYQSNPGNANTTVTELIAAHSQCIFARVLRDYSQIVLTPNVEPSTNWVVLLPLQREADPRGYNQTSWYFGYEGFEPGRLPPKNPCA